MGVVAEGDEELFKMLHGVLDLRDERIAGLIAEVDGLMLAMEHRATIEQAKGIVMAAADCTPEAAFAVLVQQSQFENRKLRDIALELVARHRGDPGVGS